jgi:hypothetical protein
MKWIFFFMFIIILSGCYNKPKNNYDSINGLSLKILQLGSYNLNTNVNDNYFLIEARLVNNTDSIVNFLILSCSLYNNFLVDSKDIIIQPNDCNRNTTYPIRLKPNQIFAVPLILHPKSGILDIDNPIRIGFVFKAPTINSIEPLLESLNSLKVEQENLIWSNSFKLYQGGEPFKIELKETQ